MVFARSIEGQELTFGVSGKLIMNAVVLYDHQTETLWSQFLAEGVQGPLTGVRMELLPETPKVSSCPSMLRAKTMPVKQSGHQVMTTGIPPTVSFTTSRELSCAVE